MGRLTDFINKFKGERAKKKAAIALNSYNRYFSQFGQNIYASDVVQQAISCIVTEMKKLIPVHIRRADITHDFEPVEDSLGKILKNPNSRMTTSDLLEKVFWQLFLNYNAFIIPTYDIEIDKKTLEKTKKYTGLYPIQPTNVEFLQNDFGTLFVRFQFLNGYETTLRYSDVIHIKYRYSVNEFMGGNQFGQPDNEALLKTLELNHTLLEGVGKALKSSFSINGVVKYKTMMDAGKMDAAIKELEKHLQNNESGLLPMDISGDFIDLKRNIQLVDSDTLKFIDEKILRHFGVPLCILTGDYTKSQYEAFYQKTLEPLIINISQAFTKVLFTPRELAFGNEVKFYPHELIFMDTSQKLELFNLLVDSESCYQNELRTAFGLYPLPELVGKLAISSNKHNALNNEGQNNSENNGGDNNANTKEEV